MTTSEIVKLVGESSKWVAEAIAAFIDGDDSEPVRRVVQILPPKLRADVEHARQRELLRKELEADGLPAGTTSEDER